MFVLNPGSGGGGKIAPGGSSNEFREKLWFFGQLGVYFAIVRGVYIFFNSGGRGLSKIKSE